MALPIFTDKYNSVGPVINPSRWIKYIFLSFIQSVFNQYDEFKWTSNRATTKIIIQDKFTHNNTNIEKIPQIIFNRGPMRWIKTSLDGNLSQETSDTKQRKRQMDLMQGSASFSCISADPTTSEHIADLVWLAIYSYRELFKPKGVRFLESVDIGECSPAKIETNSTTVEQFNTPVFLNFNYQVLYEKNINMGGRVISIPTEFVQNVYPVTSGIGDGSGYTYDIENLAYEYYVEDGDYLEIGEISGPVPVVYVPLASGIEVPVGTVSSMYTAIQGRPYTYTEISTGYFTYRNPESLTLNQAIDLVVSGFEEGEEEVEPYREPGVQAEQVLENPNEDIYKEPTVIVTQVLENPITNDSYQEPSVTLNQNTEEPE